MSGESFIETAALVAVMDGDTDRARDILRGFMSNELDDFADQVEELLCLIDDLREARAEAAS